MADGLNTADIEKNVLRKLSAMLESLQDIIALSAFTVAGISLYFRSVPTFIEGVATGLFFLFLRSRTKKGDSARSSFLSSIFLIVLTVFAMIESGDGLKDQSILIIPGCFLVGSIFVGTRLYLLICSLALGAVVLVGFDQMLGPFSWALYEVPTSPFELITILALLAGLAVLVRTITSVLLASMKESAANEADFKKILNATSEAIFMHDARTGAFVEVNETASLMYGFSREEFLSGKISIDAISSGRSPYAGAEAGEKLRACIKDGPQLFEWLAKRKDGTQFWVEVSLKHADGKILAVVRNIDDRKRFEEEMVQGEKMRAVGLLAGGIAHDFNNQLGGILGFAEVINLETDDPTIREYAGHIIASARSASSDISHLLSFARKGSREFLPLEINELIRETLFIVERTVDKKITLQTTLLSEPVMVRADRSSLQNAFLNFALNSRDALPEGGTITISSGVDNRESIYCFAQKKDIAGGPFAAVTFSDNGAGIEPEIQNRIFEPFFTTKGHGKGTGMGLSAVYGTLKSHAGALELMSIPGEGTQITLYIPLAQADSAETRDETHASSVHHGSGIAMVIDDEPVVRKISAKFLSKIGYIPREFETGTDAVDFFRQNHQNVSVVLLDMIMPEMSGLETFRELKIIDEGVKVIIVSGYSLEGEAEQLMNEGARAFIPKPYSIEDLSRVLGDI